VLSRGPERSRPEVQPWGYRRRHVALPFGTTGRKILAGHSFRGPPAFGDPGCGHGAGAPQQLPAAAVPRPFLSPGANPMAGRAEMRGRVPFPTSRATKFPAAPLLGHATEPVHQALAHYPLNNPLLWHPPFARGAQATLRGSSRWDLSRLVIFAITFLWAFFSTQAHPSL
jgi:hypothetical protein